LNLPEKQRDRSVILRYLVYRGFGYAHSKMRLFTSIMCRLRVAFCPCVSGQRSLRVLSERMNHARGSKEINRTLRPGVHRNSPLEGKPPDRTRYSLGISDKTKPFSIIDNNNGKKREKI